MKPIYLDVCALCRQYDDQSYSRIHLETIAIRLIFKKIEAGHFAMVYSPVHKFEISDISNEAERIDLLLFLEQLGVKHDIAPKTVSPVISRVEFAADARRSM